MKAIGFRATILATAVCGLLAGPAMADDDTMMTATNGPITAISPADFAWDAALINLEEIHLGQVAQTNSQNTAVQKFGRRMVRDHSRLNDHLQKIASAEGLQLPDTNTLNYEVTPPEGRPATALMQQSPEERVLNMELDVQQLASLTGPDFDRAYANAMVAGHAKAIQKYEDAAATLQDPALKKYAQSGLKVIRHHYEMACKLQKDVMKGTNAPPTM